MEPLQNIPIPAFDKLVDREKEIASYVRKYGTYLNATWKLREKDNTVVIGLTGAGKSTFCQAVTCLDSVEMDEDEGVYTVKAGLGAIYDG